MCRGINIDQLWEAKDQSKNPPDDRHVAWNGVTSRAACRSNATLSGGQHGRAMGDCDWDIVVLQVR